jgi:hypothetical protein
MSGFVLDAPGGGSLTYAAKVKSTDNATSVSFASQNGGSPSASMMIKEIMV